MPEFGRYETVQEIARSAFGSVYSARLPGGGPRFAVKVFRPPVDLLHASAGGEQSSDEARRQINRFLLCASMQQQAAAEGHSRHWAPVHESGNAPGGAFYVSDLYPRSAQKLIAGRVRLDRGGLHQMVNGVVTGLRELRRATGKPHGNIKPSNILMSGGRIARSRVALSDPASDGSEAADVRAIGELIHQLVLGRPFRVNAGWPIEPGREWARLGRVGQRWRELCSGLLDPLGQESGVTLDDLARAVRKLKPSRLARLFRGAGAVAAVGIVGGGGLFAAGYVRYQREWDLIYSFEASSLHQASAQVMPVAATLPSSHPLRPLVEFMTEGAGSSSAKGTPDEQAMPQLTASWVTGLENPPAPGSSPPLSWRTYRRVHRAALVIAAEQVKLDDFRRGPLLRIKETAAQWSQRKWSWAGELAELIARSERAPSRDVNPFQAMHVLSRYQESLQQMEEQWKQIETRQNAYVTRLASFSIRPRVQVVDGAARNAGVMAENIAMPNDLSDVVTNLQKFNQRPIWGNIDAFMNQLVLGNVEPAALSKGLGPDEKDFGEWLAVATDAWKPARDLRERGDELGRRAQWRQLQVFTRDLTDRLTREHAVKDYDLVALSSHAAGQAIEQWNLLERRLGQLEKSGDEILARFGKSIFAELPTGAVNSQAEVIKFTRKLEELNKLPVFARIDGVLAEWNRPNRAEDRERFRSSKWFKAQQSTAHVTTATLEEWLRQAVGSSEALDAIAVKATTYRSRGWTAEAEELARISSISSSEGATSARTEAEQLLPLLHGIEEQWQTLEQNKQAIASLNDKFLAGFGAFTEAYVEDSGMPRTGNAAKDLAALKERIRALNDNRDVLNVLAKAKSGWGEVLVDEFAKNPIHEKKLSDVKQLQEWLRELRDPKYLKDDFDPTSELTAAINEADKNVAQYHQELLAASERVETTTEMRSKLAASRKTLKEVVLFQDKAHATERRAKAASVRSSIVDIGESIARGRRELGERQQQIAERQRQRAAESIAALDRADFQSPFLNTAWKAAADAWRTAPPPVKETEARQACIDQLRQIEKWPAPDAVTQAAKFNLQLAGALSALAEEQKRGVLQLGVTYALSRSVPSTQTSSDSVKVAEQERSTWSQAANTFVAHTRTLADLLSQGYGLSEAQADGTSPEKLEQQLQGHPLYGNQSIKDAVAPMTGRVRKLRELSAITDATAPQARAQLLTAATDAKAPVEYALAAWTKLRTTRGAKADDATKLAQADANLAKAVRNIADETRRKALQRTCVKMLAMQADWTDGDAAAQRLLALAGAEQFDVGDVFSLPWTPEVSFNLALHQLRQTIARNPPEETAARQVAEFDKTVKPLPAQLARASVALNQVERDKSTAGGANIDQSPAGPTAQGLNPSAWKQSPWGGGGLRFQRADGTASATALDFVPVTDESYVCTTEFPVELFISLLNDAAASTVNKTALTDKLRQMRLSTWEWRNDRLSRTRQWLTESPGDTTELLTAGGRPLGTHPAHAMPPDIARFVAQLVGCRLPTRAEWDAAVARELREEKASGQAATWNLRDRTFGRFVPAGDALFASIFRYGSSDDDAATWSSADGKKYDDGTLWFAPVDKGGGVLFHHLFGNVAEFVWDPPSGATTVKPAAAPNLSALTSELTLPGSQIYVRGTSALSPGRALKAGESPDTPPTRCDVLGAYADVGFRLAFTAGRKNYLTRLNDVLKTIEYQKVAAR